MKFTESEIMELKTSTAELKEAVIAICAMLNKHKKGEIYFGVKNNGEIVGQQVSDKTLRDISKTISDNFEPKIFPSIKEVEIDGKKCIHVAFEGHDVPYFVGGRVYTRVGTENKQMSPGELERLFTNKNATKLDAGLSDKTSEDINVKVLRTYLKKANDAKRINFKYINAELTLNKLGLVKGKKLLKAAEILFCNNNNLEVQAAVFAGKDKTTFLDIQQFKGTLFDLLNKSEDYVKEHINWRADLSQGRRVDVPEIPLRALTEVLVNSLCHRDYTTSKSNEIAIFKDRIEIFNPGLFPEDVKIEDYFRGKERSMPRNPIIAGILFLSSDIERWGSGLKRIYDECKTFNVKVEFENLKTGFLVTFSRKQAGEGVSEGVSEGVNRLFDYIKSNPGKRVPQIEEALGIPKKTLERWVRELRKENKIKFEGSPKTGGYWEIIDKGKEGDKNGR